MKTQTGFSTVESVVVAAVLLTALLVPLNDSGLPDTQGKPVTTRLLESIRANHAAWAYAMSLPDA